jgi:preprotein translocase subunit YajC
MELLWATELAPLWAQAGKAAETNGLMQFLSGPALPFIMIGVLAWLMFFRPESKRRAEFQKLLEGLKKNDRVITAGGIYGTIVNVQQGSDDVTLRIDDSSNVRIRVLRTSITRVLTGEESAAEGGKSSE